MSKWRLWQDEYLGDDWNDRQEVSLPQFEGTEIPDDEIEKELLSYFLPEIRQYVEITGDEDYVSAGVDYCVDCDYLAAMCKCDNTADHYTRISYHAEKVK